MSKIKLAIDIDEVLRAKWLTFDRYYADEFNEDGIKAPFNTYDLMNHYKFEDTEVITQEVTEEFLENKDGKKLSPHEYVVDKETGVAPVDTFAFKSKKEFFTAQQMFDKFMYKDYLFEIHGSASKLYLNADVDLMVFMKIFDSYFDFVFYSKTKKEAIQSTLFFLSKMRIVCKNILFVYNDKELWNQVDWVLTTDPSVLESKPEGKITIKLQRLYNEMVKADYDAYGINAINLAMSDKELKDNTFKTFIENNTKN